MRARRAQVSADGLAADVGSFEGMSAQVQLRADLRELVDELQRLPDDQRAALVLFELGDESHAQIAAVLGVRREKVKALVFQAREALMRARDARATPCVEIREQLATVTGRVPRRSVVRRHIDRCPGCAEFEREVRRQRAAFAAILPLVPTVGLKASVLGFAVGGGGGAVALGGAGAGGGATVAAGGALAAGGVERRRRRVAGSAGAAAAGAIGTAGAASVATGLATGGGGVGLASLPAKSVVAKILSVVALGGGGAQARGPHRERDDRPPRPASPPRRPPPPRSRPTRRPPPARGGRRDGRPGARGAAADGRCRNPTRPRAVAAARVAPRRRRPRPDDDAHGARPGAGRRAGPDGRRPARAMHRRPPRRPIPPPRPRARPRPRPRRRRHRRRCAAPPATTAAPVGAAPTGSTPTARRGHAPRAPRPRRGGRRRVRGRRQRTA